MAVSVAEAGHFEPTRQTADCVAAAEVLLARATEAVRAQVAPDGTLDPALLDCEQHAVRPMSRRCARCTGGRCGWRSWAGSASWTA